MTDIFEEVDQSLREDTFATWWKRWQWIVYAVVATAILGVAGFQIWLGMRNAEIDKAAVIYDAGFAAQEAKDLTAARASFAQLETDKTGFKALAGHMLAGVERDLTNDTAAVEAHLAAAAAADTGVMGDLAIIKLAYLKADTSTLAELETVLKPLLDRTGQASALARELIGAKALAEGNVERARSEFEALALDLEAPQGVQQRVSQALSTLPARKVDLDAPATPAATPAPAAPAATPAPATPTPAQAPQ
ncbi:MAG: tetratricopeptide repeat protein [Hyphomonadaceae bacterium]|nr:tetratricopeptide repeat protein [Hyphomonadaceae bacterium]